MKRFSLFLLTCFLLSALPATTSAALQPDEVAVIANRQSDVSRKLARDYMEARGIPDANAFGLDIPPAEELSREDWEKKIRPAIRAWLSREGRLKKIRCFVTTWDIPLRITAETDPAETQRVIRYLTEERSRRIEIINQFAQTLTQLGGAPAIEDLSPDAGIDKVKERLDQAFGTAQGGVTQMSDEQLKAAAQQQLQSLYLQSVGLNMMAQSLGRQIQAGTAGSNPQIRSQYDAARGRTIGLHEGRVALEGMPFSLEREPQLLALIQLSDGVFGTVAWIDEQLSALEKNETFASFDSELSLVAWPSYQLLRWQPNLLHYRFDNSAIRDFKPTLMVSRLEAPTPELCNSLFEVAIRTEKSGLTGKVYLDARGLAKIDDAVNSGSYEDYDRALLQADALIRDHTDLEVVLDTKQDLFAEGAAPDAMLYCGWYSLAKYVDAFDWKPGAVGYHMASAEATTLRNANSQVWCKRMLDDGVTATLGPVAEPYISAFPRPNEFFALLLSGEYTLAESYYRCVPFTSWTMTLVGDPLYNPFQANSPLRRDELEPLYRRILDGPSALLTDTPATQAPEVAQ